MYSSQDKNRINTVLILLKETTDPGHSNEVLHLALTQIEADKVHMDDFPKNLQSGSKFNRSSKFPGRIKYTYVYQIESWELRGTTEKQFSL